MNQLNSVDSRFPFSGPQVRSERKLHILYTPKCNGDARRAAVEGELHHMQTQLRPMTSDFFLKFRSDWHEGKLDGDVLIIIVGASNPDTAQFLCLAQEISANPLRGIDVRVYMRSTSTQTHPEKQDENRTFLHNAARESRQQRFIKVFENAEAQQPLSVVDFKGEDRLRSNLQFFLKRLGLERGLDTYDRDNSSLRFAYAFQQEDVNGTIETIAKRAYLAGLNIETLSCNADEEPISVKFSGTFSPETSLMEVHRFSEWVQREYPARPIVFVGASPNSMQRYVEKERRELLEMSVRGVETVPGRLGDTLQAIHDNRAGFSRILVKQRYRDHYGRSMHCKDIFISLDVAALHSNEALLERLFRSLMRIRGYMPQLRIAPSEGPGKQIESRVLESLNILPAKVKNKLKRLR